MARWRITFEIETPDPAVDPRFRRLRGFARWVLGFVHVSTEPAP